MNETVKVMILDNVTEGTPMYYRKKTRRDYARLILRGRWRAARKLRGWNGYVAEVCGNFGNISSDTKPDNRFLDKYKELAASYGLEIIENDDGGEK